MPTLLTPPCTQNHLICLTRWIGSPPLWQTAVVSLWIWSLSAGSPIAAMPDDPCSGGASHISTLTVNIVLPAGTLPQDIAAQCAATSFQTEDGRRIGLWAMTEYHWLASCMRHRPLYFEEIGLERYGHATCCGLQPFVSAVRFFANAAALPYKMTQEHPSICIYTIGHPRPGNSVPRHCWRTPLNIRAGLVEAGAVAGLILLIP